MLVKADPETCARCRYHQRLSGLCRMSGASKETICCGYIGDTKQSRIFNKDGSRQCDPGFCNKFEEIQINWKRKKKKINYSIK